MTTGTRHVAHIDAVVDKVADPVLRQALELRSEAVRNAVAKVSEGELEKLFTDLARGYV